MGYYVCYQELLSHQNISSKQNIDSHRHYYVWIYVMSKFYRPRNVDDYEKKVAFAFDEIEREWDNFNEYVSKLEHNRAYIKKVKVLDSDEQKLVFNFRKYMTSSRTLVSDIEEFFKKLDKPEWAIQ